MHVGYLGHGELTIVGSDSTIDIAGVYSQGEDSELTLELGADSPHISTIAVEGVATFAEGAKIKIDPQAGYVPGYRTITILTASDIDGVENIDFDAPDEWELVTDSPPTVLYAMNTHLNCGLLGIEPVLVLGALHARRRWKRSRSGAVDLG
jgi:hypothetical protein